MFLYIVKWSIVYIIVIVLVHNLYKFFEKNLTTTKTNDLYYNPIKEYHTINGIIDKEVVKDDTDHIDDRMKEELNEYLHSLKTNK